MCHNLFYTPPDKIFANEIIIDGEGFHHLKNVLRKKVHDIIFVTNGKGSRYKTKITHIVRSQVRAEILDKVYIRRKSIINLALAFVPLKGSRNDFIFEKGTELGVITFLPFMSKFSVVRTLGHAKLDRFKNVAVSAMLQSQRYHIPEIVFQKDVSSLLQNFGDFDYILLADKRGKADIPSDGKSILYIVGPEGGFDDSETELFKESHVQPLSLGVSRLRSETAAITGVVKIMTAYGEI